MIFAQYAKGPGLSFTTTSPEIALGGSVNVVLDKKKL